MTVRVTKPALNVREKLTELDLPKGNHGTQVLKSNSLKETCDLVGSGRRNLLINGGFDVWQRGTTFTTPSAHYYAADRWQIYRASSSLTTTTRESFNVGQSEVPGNPRHFMRVSNVPDADQTWLEIAQHIEDVTQFSDKWVTLSFWMRANKPQEAQEDYWTFQYNFGSGGSPSSDYQAAMTPKFDIYTKWRYYEFPVYLADIQGKTIGTDGVHTSSLKLQLLRGNAVAADTYYDIANVQLELGRGATPFENRSYGEELALCQRYYHLYLDSDTNASNQAPTTPAIVYNNTSLIWCPIQHRLPMRIAPSLDKVDGSNYYTVFYNNSNANVSGIVLSRNSPLVSEIYFTGASVTQGTACWLRGNNAAAKIAFDAEFAW
tara:strand:+ start:2386 stop:3513 length:1128 start_codon:yes stop_codon:yes gene_type:complete